MTTNNEEKKIKKKGPIRFEAIIPITIICTLTFVYFSYYFDQHVKKAIEYVGTQANGAEVNVGSIHTSFLKGSFSLNKLQVTDKEKPELNALEIENMHFQFMWDALLRMKFVVDDASITNIQILKPRSHPGKVLPPEPAKPSKINEIQEQVFAQVKNRYSNNMLGDAVALLDGGDLTEQLNEIRGTLKSEAKVQGMISDIKGKKEFWDSKVKELSDTKKIKNLETEVKLISKEKNFLKQVQGAKKVAEDFKEIEKQYKDIQTASNQLKGEIQNVSKYPQELQQSINEDIESLKGRFSIPKVDFKDMALHLFAGEFAGYIAKARKYQALAKQYIPEKKEDQEEIIPRQRSQGKTYTFPITTSYPLFWLKRAAISSKGTAQSYSGDLSGELTNVTNEPKHIKKPVILALSGNFPASKIMGVSARITIDHTKNIPRQSAVFEVNSFQVPEKIFVNNEKLKFGFLNAQGSSKFSAELTDGEIQMNWNSQFSRPSFLVETKTKIAKEMLSNILGGISVITIDGSASGKFTDLNMSINSNLGDELSQGFSREIGAKVAEAQNKLDNLIQEKIKAPQQELTALLGSNSKNLTSLNGIQDLYNKNKERISKEIKKLTSGGGNKQIDDLKEQGKKLLKGFKL
jgi:uncharacterized protein (TIGR03545 family)